MTTVDLYVDDRGFGELPLVLVHGFTGSAIDWTDVIDPLAERRRVLAPDHRGHGRSPNLGDAVAYSFDLLTADLLAALDQRGVERFDLLGHSMGGIVAQLVVRDHPERVRSLILMDTGAASIGEGLGAWLEPMAELGRAQGMAAVFDQNRELMTALLQGDEARRAVLAARGEEKYGQLDVEAFAALGRQLGDYSLVEWLVEITCPTTVMVGENDAMLRDAADVLAERIAGARLEVVAGAGHCPQEDDPATWLRIVEEHLTRVGPSGPPGLRPSAPG